MFDSQMRIEIGEEVASEGNVALVYRKTSSLTALKRMIGRNSDPGNLTNSLCSRRSFWRVHWVNIFAAWEELNVCW